MLLAPVISSLPTVEKKQRRPTGGRPVPVSQQAFLRVNMVLGPAHSAIEAACKQANAESKLVFIKSGYPDCVWCRIFDQYLSGSDVRQIFERYYVVVTIDIENMPDGRTVFSTYAKPGAPSWVIITPQKRVIVDSHAPEGDVGYPGRPDETTYYLAALKKATPAISDDELHTLSVEIQRAMETGKSA